MKTVLLASALALALAVAVVAWPNRSSAAAEKPAVPAGGLAVATFAGGCFWCMEPPFDKIDGVIDTTSGYTGGTKKNPTYEEVSSGETGHTEALQVRYDPKKVTYEKLLDTFWHNIDPVTQNAQFCDRGTQYRSAIFYQDEAQMQAALASKQALEAGAKLPAKIVTQIVAASVFWPAEQYHQDYYQKNPVRYNFYRQGCGRDRRLKQLWGDLAGGH